MHNPPHNDPTPATRSARERDPRSVTTVEPAVLGEAEASRYLGFARSYLRQQRMFGRGPAFVRIGRAIRYRRADLDGWLSAHVVGPDSPAGA